MTLFSIYALLDGFIHYAAFLLSCGVLFLFLKGGTCRKPLSVFLRAVVIIGGLGVCRLYGLKWMVGLIPAFLILVLLSFLLIYLLLKPPVLVGCIAALISVCLLLFLEQTAIRLSRFLMPEGPTFAMYMGLEERVDTDATALPAVSEPTVDPAESNAPQETAIVPDVEEPMRAPYFQDAYTVRRAWMADQSTEEREQNCEETASFLYGQGYANNDYSIAAIQTVDSANLIELVSFFNRLKGRPEDEFSLQDATEQMLDKLVGIALTESDLEMLNVFSGLCIQREIDRAMEIAGEEVQLLRGQSEFAGTVLLAMAQAGSGYPIDLLLVEQRNSGPLDQQKIFALASSHWKRRGLMLTPLSASTLPSEPMAVAPFSEDVSEPAKEMVAAETQPAEQRVVESAPVPDAHPEPEPVPEPLPEPAPFIVISTHLGRVYVPDQEELMHEWIAAANALKIRGYVALGDEIVILKMEGTFLRKDQEWLHDMKGYTYHFKLESIQKNRVSMRAAGREKINP